jgi:hypothetical protein
MVNSHELLEGDQCYRQPTALCNKDNVRQMQEVVYSDCCQMIEIITESEGGLCCHTLYCEYGHRNSVVTIRTSGKLISAAQKDQNFL